MSRSARILVGGVGSPLGQSIARAAMASPSRHEVFVSDVDALSRHIFPQLRFWESLHWTSDRYVDQLCEFLEDAQIDLVFLGSETEMLMLTAEKRFDIESATGARFAISGPYSLKQGTDKYRIVQVLESLGLPFPKTMPLDRPLEECVAFAREVGFPCLVKGRRSGIPIIVRSEEELVYQGTAYPNAVVQEFLGKDRDLEYTMGVFRTGPQGPCHTFGMTRELRYGLTWRGQSHTNSDLVTQAVMVAEALQAEGSINVQAREHNGRPVIHEVNVRCSSTTVFRALAGWNEIDMGVDWFVDGAEPAVPGALVSGTAVRFFEERWIPND